MKDKKEMHKQIMGDKKDMHDDFFYQLDSATQDAIKALHTSYQPKFEAIKNDTTKTKDEKEAAMKALHEELHAKVRALIPADLLTEFDTMKDDMADMKDAWKLKKDEMKAEWKNTKEAWKAKREERRTKMKARHRIVFGKLDNVLTKFEAQKTTAQLIEKYTAIVTKLDEKLATIDDSTDLYTFLKSLSDDLKDRIAELEASE